MKRIMILLTATTLVLVPFASNAKKPTITNDYNPEVSSCSCVSEQGPEEGDVIYTCDVSWADVIAGSYDTATYGASIDVEWEGIANGSAPAEIEYDDWSEVCDGTTCTVEKPFQLENYNGQTITLTAAVKAFDNRSDGERPRNFEKSKLDCDIDPIESIDSI